MLASHQFRLVYLPFILLQNTLILENIFSSLPCCSCISLMVNLEVKCIFNFQVLEDDSSPGVTTDADSEDPSYCDTESPTPTNSAVTIDPKNYWQGAEEHRELLATEGEEEDDDDEGQVDQDDQRDIELVDINSSDSEVGTSNNPSSDSDGGNLSYSNEGIFKEHYYYLVLIEKNSQNIYRFISR